MTKALPLTPDELCALRAFANRHGRNWKQALRDVWLTGRYNWARDDAGQLQTLRNTRGPSWLVSFRMPPDDRAPCTEHGPDYRGPCGH